MSLDVYLTVEKVCEVEVHEANITHNLNKMASKAGLYDALWRPEDIGARVAIQLIEPLELGLKELKSNPVYYKGFNPKNGWGSYDGLVVFVENYLEKCKEYPASKIEVCR